MWMIKEKNLEEIEALETIELVEEEPTKVTKFGLSINPLTKGEIVKFLEENLDVFSWSHEDMTSIFENIIQHCLNESRNKTSPTNKKSFCSRMK